MQKLYKTVLLLIVAICMICFLGSCASQIPSISLTKYEMKSPLTQSQGGLTVDLEMLDPSLGCLQKHPELFAFNSKNLHEKFKLNAENYCAVQNDGKRYCYTFGIRDYYLTAALVKISNNTNHILRMKDARIYLRLQEEDPVKAVTKLGNPSLEIIDQKGNVLPKSAIEGDESLIHWVTYLENVFKSNQKGIILYPYPVGLASQVILQNKGKYKLITDVDTEILPGDTYTGILLFPTVLTSDKYSKANIKFYDLTTKTDAAGNPVEKVTFDFEFNIKTLHMWWDKNQNKWIEGDPPSGA